MQKSCLAGLRHLLAGAVVILTGVTVAETPAAEPVPGKEVYTRNCSACHGNGAAGAPKLGDTANWAPRLAQGMAVMDAHAIKGYQGKSGYMPAKGGFNSLTDEEVVAAVAYMAGESD
ncbi:MAG: c-type cytochrome [Gammaproteobacteria bacterium]|nr:c-type cytochrome [Gammaproteobacteria bacterium]